MTYLFFFLFFLFFSLSLFLLFPNDKKGTLPMPGLKPDPQACPQNGEGKPEILGLFDVTPVENFYVR